MAKEQQSWQSSLVNGTPGRPGPLLKKTGLISGEFPEDITCSYGSGSMRWAVPWEASSSKTGMTFSLVSLVLAHMKVCKMACCLFPCLTVIPSCDSLALTLSLSSCVQYGLNENSELILITYEHSMHEYSEHVLMNVSPPCFSNLSLL